MNRQKIGLGSVQWGLQYGVYNTSGQTPDREITSILASARAHGVDLIDTACLYGDAETKLGQQRLDSFRIVSKTPHCASIVDAETVSNFLHDAIQQSLRKLKIDRLYGYLVHQADDLLGPKGPMIVASLCQFKEQGLVDRVGVSVYSKEQLDAITAFFVPDLIQVPINVIDQRLIKNGTLKRMKDLGVEIHARSTYLQGLLLMPLSQVPEYFIPVLPLLNNWHQRIQANNLKPAQAAIAFVRDIPEIDQIIIGVENTQQLEEACRYIQETSSFDASGLDCDDPTFIDPRFWKLK